MPYVSEPLPTDDISALLNAQWNTQGGSIPEPTFVVLNNPSSPQLRYNLRAGDYVFIASDTPTEEEIPIGNWTYGNRTTRIMLQLATEVTRQRLYDLKQEIRRICHSQMHSMTNYQRLQYISFIELTDTQLNLWVGNIVLELQNNAIALET